MSPSRKKASAVARLASGKLVLRASSRWPGAIGLRVRVLNQGLARDRDGLVDAGHVVGADEGLGQADADQGGIVQAVSARHGARARWPRASLARPHQEIALELVEVGIVGLLADQGVDVGQRPLDAALEERGDGAGIARRQTVVARGIAVEARWSADPGSLRSWRASGRAGAARRADPCRWRMGSWPQHRAAGQGGWRPPDGCAQRRPAWRRTPRCTPAVRTARRFRACPCRTGAWSSGSAGRPGRRQTPGRAGRRAASASAARRRPS